MPCSRSGSKHRQTLPRCCASSTLHSLLALKFQTVGHEYEACLQAATPDVIDRYLRRLLTADSLAAVFVD
jgi:hypothetical protein